MRILIVEDDLISRMVLSKLLAPYGENDIATNGQEALQAFQAAWLEKKPYDLICMDIMMPAIDGQEALRQIRDLEKQWGVRGAEEVKVIMISALDDPKNVVEAYYQGGATSYLVKPITSAKLRAEIDKLFSFSSAGVHINLISDI